MTDNPCPCYHPDADSENTARDFPHGTVNVAIAVIIIAFLLAIFAS